MANTTNFGWETPDDTDLVKDGALAMRTLGNAIDTSLVDLKGGTSGQILAKNTNTDMDFVWINNDQGDITAVSAGTGLSGGGTTGAVTLSIDSSVATLTGSQTLTNKTIALDNNTISGTISQFNTALTDGDFATIAGSETLTNKTLTSPVLTTPSISNIDAKGDLLVGTADNTIGRLAVGTDGHYLTADSTTATGLKWAAVASSPVKAWVEFDGTGTVTILASNNVSSITDNGVGVYKVNFTTAIGSNNYCFLLSVAKAPGAIDSSTARLIYAQEDEIKSASLQVNVTNGNYSLADSDYVSVAVLA